MIDMRILLISANRPLFEVLAEHFEKKNSRIDLEVNVDEALIACRVEKYDAIIYAMDHVTDVAKFASAKRALVTLGSRRSLELTVQALRLGSDDFMTLDYLMQPGALEELELRLNGCVRRRVGYETKWLKAGRVALNFDDKSVYVDRKPAHITRTQYKFLECLLLRRDRVVRRDDLMSYAYGGMNEPQQKILDVFICQLRRKFANTGMRIENVFSQGYRLIEEPAEAA